MKKNLIKKLSSMYYRLLSFFKRGFLVVKKLSKDTIFKARVGAVFAAFVLTASIFAWGTIDNGLAWFMKNEKVNSSGMNVAFYSSDVNILEFTPYAVTAIEESSYTFKDLVVADIPRYEPAEIDYSELKKAVVLKITYAIKESSSNNFSLYMECSEGASAIYLNDNFISNCISIRSGTASGDGEAGFTSALFTASEQKFSFWSDLDTLSKVNQAVLVDNLPKGTNTLYFVLEYDMDVITKISNEMLDNSNFDDVIYNNDVTFIIR